MRIIALSILFAATALAAPPPEATLAQLQGQRRVFMIAAPRADDAQYLAQLQALSGWRGGEDRDITLVRIEGDSTLGSADSATDLRRRYQLPAAHFSATLIGKDGHIALRSQTPVPAVQLESVIDAMPMRRAGER